MPHPLTATTLFLISHIVVQYCWTIRQMLVFMYISTTETHTYVFVKTRTNSMRLSNRIKKNLFKDHTQSNHVCLFRTQSDIENLLYKHIAAPDREQKHACSRPHIRHTTRRSIQTILCNKCVRFLVSMLAKCIYTLLFYAFLSFSFMP